MACSCARRATHPRRSPSRSPAASRRRSRSSTRTYCRGARVRARGGAVAPTAVAKRGCVVSMQWAPLLRRTRSDTHATPHRDRLALWYLSVPLRPRRRLGRELHRVRRRGVPRVSTRCVSWPVERAFPLRLSLCDERADTEQFYNAHRPRPAFFPPRSASAPPHLRRSDLPLWFHPLERSLGANFTVEEDKLAMMMQVRFTVLSLGRQFCNCSAASAAAAACTRPTLRSL